MFYEKYSTWKGRSVHLEDFVVKASERRKGIGALLFEEVMRIAKDRNYARMDWQVLDWNESAIAFYKKYNANLTTEWVDGRFTREELQRK
jgi:GNAT superfamily N-acetyltransferase